MPLVSNRWFLTKRFLYIKTKNQYMKASTTKLKIKYELHKWKKQLLIADKFIIILIFLLFGFFRADYLIIITYFLVIPYLILSHRKELLYHLFVSSSLAIVWMILAREEYSYNQQFLSVAGISLYPLFTWALGLFAVYLIYSHYEHIFMQEGHIKQFILFTLIYWILLIMAETVAYYGFNIRNVATTTYAGLPICKCMHSPVWMQISYFLMGPIFFILCSALKLDNPHIKIIRRKN